MKLKLKNQEKGFTIIEVLIVLAIAGLIILVVFLAVPALQRNSRNTQRKNDVSAIGGALTEYVNNNNGTIPATCTGASSPVCPFFSNAKTSLYDLASGNTKFTKQTAATAPAAVTNADNVEFYSYAKCNGNASTTTGATSRSIIALYAVESGGGTTAQCQEL